MKRILRRMLIGGVSLTLLLCHCVACLSGTVVSSGDLFSWTVMLGTCIKLLVRFCCQCNNNLYCVCVCVCVCACAHVSACVHACVGVDVGKFNVGKVGELSESSVIFQTKTN